MVLLMCGVVELWICIFVELQSYEVVELLICEWWSCGVVELWLC